MSRRFSMMPLFLALAAISPVPSEPPPSGECRRCGAPLDGIDKMSGQTQCRACRVPTVLHHIESHRPVTMASKIEPIAAPSYRPIDLTCPTCGAKPRAECDRRTMGKRWEFHRARVDAAGGAQ